jgi:uncharacterized protein (TIGR03435 family)
MMRETMTNRPGFVMKLLLVTIGATVLVGPLAFGINPPLRHGQSTDTDWEKVAGGKMAFEVASVKRSAPEPESYHSNFPLTLGASNFASVGSFMSANVPLRTLIGFAFKLSAGQTHFLISGLPDWVDSESFDIEARAPINNPSKDQFRLMVQSLLADRFKFTVHKESRQLPIYALVLTKQGKTGPQLRPHVDDATCGAAGRADAPLAPAEFSPFPCGATVMGISSIPGRVRGGGRNVSLDYIAAFLTGTGMQGTASDRPVVNQTGLTENCDFWIEFAPDASRLPNGAQPDPNGPSFPEALQDQLGLRLTAKTGTVDVLVVNHIEEPTAN